MAKKINVDKLSNLSGENRKSRTLLESMEKKLINRLIPLVPAWVETYHLTLTTVPMIFVLLFGGILANKINSGWIWLSIVAMIIQHLADCLDGAVGRSRDTGLIYWGFFTDHFLDFIFNACHLVVFSLIFNGSALLYFSLLIALAGFFLLELHKCNFFGKYNIHGYDGIGSTEIKILVLTMYLFYLIVPASILRLVLSGFAVYLWLQLAAQFVKLQKKLWKLDMERQRKVE